MKYEELDNVVLNKDLPEHGPRKGDLGAVVMVYEPDAGRNGLAAGQRLDVLVVVETQGIPPAAS